jgi:hypothetical protein
VGLLHVMPCILEPDWSLCSTTCSAALAPALGASDHATLALQAFAAVAKTQKVSVDKLVRTKSLLLPLLKYHISPARIYRTNFFNGQKITTLAGATYKLGVVAKRYSYRPDVMTPVAGAADLLVWLLWAAAVHVPH